MRRVPLAVSHPELVASFDVERNGCDPSQAFEERLWWRCPVADDHVWDATVGNRASGHGCPFCTNKRVTVSNCLATVNPELSAQWHPTLNGDLSPADVVPRSGLKVWWKCDAADDHVWETPPHKRSAGHGCPFCSGHQVTESNCLATVDPERAALWHPTLNGDLSPTDVVPGANKMAWWKCNEADDHVWSTNTISKTPGRCPYCTNRKVCESNCMATTHPHLATQLHPTLNGDITAHNIVAGSRKMLWWRCPKFEAHAWQQRASSRKRNQGAGCPHC